MSIKITCSSCNATYEVKDELAGKRAKCSKCGNIIEIPKISLEENTFSNEDNIITENINPVTPMIYGAIKDESVMNHNPLINENPPKKNSFIKFLKTSFIIILFLLSIFFLSIYISSLFSYKETDFNIPEGALNSKHFDKKYDSEQNGYLDLVKVVDNIEKENDLINYYNLRYLCNFSEIKYEKESNCKKSEVYKFDDFKETDEEKIKQYLKENEKKHLKEITNIIEKNQQELMQIIKKDYIYSNIGTKNTALSLTDIIRIFRSSIFIANEYINYGIQEKGIQILLNNREIINGLMEKSDLDLGENLVLIKCANYNLNGIEYIIKNHKIKTTEKQKLKQILEKILNYNLIDNGLKRYYKDKIGTEIKKSEAYKLKNKILFSLFFSESETNLIYNNYIYNIIQNKGSKINLENLKFNLNNYIGRKIYNINLSNPSYNNDYKKEADLIEKQGKILEKLK